MFKFEVVCDDKHLAKILRLLAGSGAHVGPPIPIVEAGPMRGPLMEGLNAAGSAVWAGIQADKLTEVRPKQCRQYLKRAGLSEGSTNYALNNLLAHKHVRKTSTIGLYRVNGVPT